MPKPQGRNYRGNRFAAITGVMFPKAKAPKPKPKTEGVPLVQPNKAKPTASPAGGKRAPKGPKVPMNLLLDAMSAAVRVR